MEIKKTYRSIDMSIDLCKDSERGVYVILCTKCSGQRDYVCKTWNEAQKKLSEIVWLSSAHEAPRK